jgi:hypothetical protein
MGILTNRRRCHLQLDNLKLLVFVSKNLPSDFRVGCKPPSNLVELIRTYLDFEKDSKEFEDSFEQDGHIKC